MDNARTFLLLALGAVLVLLWQAWQQDYGQRPSTARGEAPSGPTETAPSAPKDIPQAPAAPAAPAAEKAPSGPQTPEPAAKASLDEGQAVRVITDVLDLRLSTAGGDLRRLDLPSYPVAVDQPDSAHRLLTDQPGQVFVAQSGLRARAAEGDQAPPAPSHHATYQAQREVYRLADGRDRLTVPLTWEQGGIRVTKTYTFHRGRYLVEVTHRVENTGERPWQGSLYTQLKHVRSGKETQFFLPTYRGGAYYDTAEEKMVKVDFDDMAESRLRHAQTGGWLAMLHHYFIGAWIPPQDTEHHYYTLPPDNELYVLGSITPPHTAAPGETAVFESRLYAGPKRQDALGEIAPGLDLTVDYGIFTILSKPLFIALDWIHGIVGNWGWAIIILTVLIKAAFYKLSQTSYRSMAHMRRVQPRIQAIREQYSDDRQRMNQALMDLYKNEKINPLGGCLPILVQIPVFIALYWVLLGSVELRQAPFMLWIQDLSSPDPFYVLPLLMGVSMFVQQRLNPHPLDPIQQKVMMVLPVVFTVFFAFFPAGLVLYWVVNNVLSIAQQWWITRQIEGKPAKA